jgi:hypothetical protein
MPVPSSFPRKASEKGLDMSSRIRRFGRFLWRGVLVLYTIVLFSPLILKIINDLMGDQ